MPLFLQHFAIFGLFIFSLLKIYFLLIIIGNLLLSFRRVILAYFLFCLLLRLFFEGLAGCCFFIQVSCQIGVLNCG